MKNLMETGYKPIDSLDNASDGRTWGFLEKALLGLTPKEYIRQVVRNPFNWIFGIILAIGLPLIAYRYLFGLGAVTHC